VGSVSPKTRSFKDAAQSLLPQHFVPKLHLSRLDFTDHFDVMVDVKDPKDHIFP